MSDVILISGSPAEKSKSNALLALVAGLLAEYGLSAKQIGVRDFPAEDLLQGRWDSPAFTEAKALIAGAKGIVIATPIYKASYSGALKTFLDILPQDAFRGKALLPIATGGSINHLLAIDYALKPVLCALSATEVFQGVYVVDSQFKFTEAGQPDLDPVVAERFREAVADLADAVHSRRLRS